MKKGLKILLFVVLPILLGLVFLLLLVLPYGLKRYFNEHGRDYVGRTFSVGDLKINYFAATFSVLDFKLLEADNQTTFVSFDSLTVKISPFPLLSSRLVVDQFRLVKPFVRIVRKDSLYNFDDMIAFQKAKPKAEPSEKPAKAFQYLLKNINLEQGKLLFNDQTVNHTTTLNDLKFLIPSISFNEQELKDVGIKFHFENGGSFQATTDFDQKRGSYKVDFSLENLDIAPFLPYTKNYFQLSALQGLLGGEFHLAGNIHNVDSLLFRGKGRVAGFSASDLTNQKVLAAKQGRVTFGNSYPMKFIFRMDEISLSEPYLYAAMKDSTINLLNLMVETPADTVPFHYYYSINKLQIEGGKMDLRDNTYEEPFDYHLSEVAMKVDSISSDSKWVHAFSTMRLNERGKLQGELGINPSDPYEVKVNYVITNFQLTDLNCYSKHFVGFPILLGNMYYKGNTIIHGKQLKSENKLIVRNARLGKKSGGVMNLPLKLALYLLKDIHGDIVLDLPLTGDLNNPSTKIGKLVWQMLKNVVVKIVASPFIALSGLLGVAPAEAKGLEFGYADTTLTATHLRRIRTFTNLEEKKPDMKIELIAYNDAGLERNELALAEAGKLFKTASGTDASKEQAAFKSFLAQKLGTDTMTTVSGCSRLIGAHKLDSLQQLYTGSRIRQIESELRRIKDATRIKIVIPNKETPENIGSRPVFELKFSIEE